MVEWCDIDISSVPPGVEKIEDKEAELIGFKVRTTGGEYKDQGEECPVCGGSGDKKLFNGQFYKVQVKCKRCDGTGKLKSGVKE